ncbi:hypothetical protein ACIP6X_04200 [Streptomyces coeruleorubidus]|uniref:hypothetical protein n=1 Tax=Streptomyces coeruleorubidus TaxID=116188 RepID=UPI0037F37978
MEGDGDWADGAVAGSGIGVGDSCLRQPGGAAKTFTVTVQNFTKHSVKHVDVAYSTYAADQPVLKEVRPGL